VDAKGDPRHLQPPPRGLGRRSLWDRGPSRNCIRLRLKLTGLRGLWMRSRDDQGLRFPRPLVQGRNGRSLLLETAPQITFRHPLRSTTAPPRQVGYIKKLLRDWGSANVVTRRGDSPLPGRSGRDRHSTTGGPTIKGYLVPSQGLDRRNRYNVLVRLGGVRFVWEQKSSAGPSDRAAFGCPLRNHPSVVHDVGGRPSISQKQKQARCGKAPGTRAFMGNRGCGLGRMERWQRLHGHPARENVSTGLKRPRPDPGLISVTRAAYTGRR